MEVNMDFKRTQGLKKDSDFRKVYKHGKSFANRNLVMYILDNKSDYTRVGISVSKKVGNAINRNKVKGVYIVKNKKNAFTLVELLAVIAVLGLVLIIAVPKITSTIENSKKKLKFWYRKL